MVKATPQPLYPRERPGTHCRELGWHQSLWANDYGPSEILPGSNLVDASVGVSSLWLVGRYHSLGILVLLKYAAFGVFLD